MGGEKVVSRVMRKFVCRLRAPSQLLPHHTPNGFRCLDLHGIGGVRVGAQGEAGIATHLYFLPKDEPEERNRRPGSSFPLVNKLFECRGQSFSERCCLPVTPAFIFHHSEGAAHPALHSVRKHHAPFCWKAPFANPALRR